MAVLHGLVADISVTETAEAGIRQVLVGIETERGPWVQALIAAGYVVYAVNPVQVARYRERHGTIRGEERSRGTPTCWPSWSGWTGPITARSPGTPRSPSM